MKLISAKENPEFKARAIRYFQNKWASEQSMMVYEKYGFEYIDKGYHPWGDSSRIYKITL